MPSPPSSVQPLCCRPLLAADVEPAGAQMSLAFLHDPLSRYLFPDDARRPERLTWLMKTFLRYGQQFGTAIVVGSEPVGTAVWVSSGNAAATARRLLRSGWAWAPFKLGGRACRRLLTVMPAVEHARRRHLPHPHWYLLSLSVSPMQHRKGLGGALLRTVLDQTTPSRMPCYLETFNPANRPFYERHGFELLSEHRVPGCDLPFWAMARRPPIGQARET